MTERYGYTYDHSSRLTKVTHQYDNRPSVILVEHTYDELGRSKAKKYHNGICTISYDYNIRGWLTDIEGNKFRQCLHYTDGLGVACYNGNISSLSWRSGDETTDRGYKFTYDGLSRLKAAVYGEGTGLSANANRFNEQVTGYDKMGNILGLKRYGQTTATGYNVIDDLSLSYDGNQLKKVTDSSTGSAFNGGFEFKDGADAATEYEYDENGNLTKDLNKKITDIQYNCLNLPSLIRFEDGNSISYVYDANGKKLCTTHLIDGVTTTTDNCGSVIYENGVAKTLLTEVGYVSLADNKYHYFLQDHQGNNRVVVDQNGTVEEVNHYYPFGGVFANSQSVQPYKYNGKELDRKGGLDWYDYGARHYDAEIGRWHTVDPMAEDCYGVSSYVYCLGDPVNFVDIDGNQAVAVAKSARYISNPSRLVRMYRAIKAFFFGTAVGTGGTTIYNHFVDGDKSQEVFESLVSPLNDTLDAQTPESKSVESTSTEDSGSAASSSTPNGDNREGKKGNTSSGNKNSPHANQKAKASAGQKYNKVKNEYKELNDKPNKTSEDKKLLKKLENQVKHWKKKKDFSGENHSNNAKGNRQ